MKLSRVKLSGFKSFVDPVELAILPGLTGIVGPNGCGKSNLLEAIRWAMGEGSPKSLRGGGMEDVIFAGTAKRPQRQFAEVSILGENNEQDIDVTRRIERGAGSAYRINGRDARARDAQLLFADAATGAHSPALVSQGKIGAVIAAKPAERRAMLEEAAGIAGLHVRRHEAEIRLKATEANLTRVAEMVAEMDVRIAALRRQARSAQRYRNLSDAIKVAEGRLVFARWRDAAAAADAARAEAKTAEQRVGIAAEAQRVAAALSRDAAETLAATRGAAQSARDAAAEARHALTAAETDVRTIQTRLGVLAANRERLNIDREREGELARDASDALARLSGEIQALDARIAAADALQADRQAAVAVAEAASRDAELALARETAQAAQRRADRQVAEASYAAAVASLDRDERALERALADAGALPRLADIETDLANAMRDREQAEQAAVTALARMDAADIRREQAAAHVADAQTERSRAAAAAAALDSEARSLAPANVVQGALGVVSAARGYEVALAAALADDLAADIGSASTAPRRWTGAVVSPDDPPLTAGPPLAASVTAPPELLRRLTQIAVVEEDDGVSLAVGQRLVTRGGKLRRWDGFVSEGAGSAEAERLVRRNRLSDIEAQLPTVIAATKAAECAVNDATRALSTATGEAMDARRLRDAADATLRAALRSVDAASAAVDRWRTAHSEIERRRAAAAAEHETAQRDVETARAFRDALPPLDETDQMARRAAAAQSARDAVASARIQLAAMDAALGADRARRTLALAEIADWRTRSGTATKRIEDMAQRGTALDAEATALEGAPDEAAARILRCEQSAKTATAAAEASLQAERAAEGHLREREDEAARVAEVLSLAREERAAAVARAESQETRRVEMGRISGERFECSPPLLPEKLGFVATDVDDAQREAGRLDALTMERERLGPVNLIAESELAQLEATRLEANAEAADLTEATHRLRGSIANLNREGRLKLRLAFEAVDGHFRTLFRTLFDGGEAHLELVDADDPLSAGLEIMAQPPGKKLSSMTLLSGGEQALTAIALIFALFLTNPAPLCVLDEVDAPLDDANVERLCGLLDMMARDTTTRYLIVTHNAVTMARMHRLYGVTMIEQGVSRLVSVDLGGAEALLAAE